MGPRPLRCHAAGVPMHASQKLPKLTNTPRTPTTPRHHPEPQRREAPKARHRLPGGKAGKRWKPRPRSAGRPGRETPQGAAWLNSPKKPNSSHAAGRTASRSPAMSAAHSHAAPQAFPCPRIRNAPDPPRHPEPPEPAEAPRPPRPRGRYLSIVRRQGWAPQRGMSTSSTGTARGAPAQRAR